MEFCIISPTAGLKRYATLSRTHMVLAHIQSPEYERFYLERQQMGDFLILDNGAYETGLPLTGKELAERIKLYRPNVAVLPDLPNRPWRDTLDSSIDFLDSYAKRFPQVEWLYIPQTRPEAMSDWYTGLRVAATHIHISWIGLSRIPALQSGKPHIRMEWAAHIREHYPRLKVHAMGMMAGDWRELYYLDKLGVCSIDSSAPVWRGWNGILLNGTEWGGLDVNFDAPESEYNLFIEDNLRRCGINVRTTQTR